MKYLVTGATGKFGGKVVDALLEKIDPSQIAVSVRDVTKANSLKAKGVEVRQGNFDDLDGLTQAFKGVERLLIVSTDGDNATRIKQHQNAVTAAKAAGVKFIAYTSVVNADQSELFLAEVHKKTEEAIKETGINYAFLRNNWYLENELSSIQGVLSGAPWLTSAENGRVGWAIQKDYAEAAAKALLDESLVNATFELSGPLYTQSQLADIVAKVSGKEVVVKNVSDEEYRETMAGFGLPDFILDMVVSIQQDIRKGTLDVEADDFEKLLGRQRTPIDQAINQLIKGFKA